MDITTITLSGASSNQHDYKKMASKETILALIIPNSLFSLWKRREIDESLMQEKSKLAEKANASFSLSKIVRLNTCACSKFRTRLQSESHHFQAKFKQTPGRRRYQMLSKSTNIMLLKDEVVPNVSS